MRKGWSLEGRVSIGVEVIDFLSLWNASSLGMPHWKATSFFERSKSGRASLEKCGMKCLSKLVKPRKDWTSFQFFGVGHSATPVTFVGSILTWLWEMMTQSEFVQTHI